MERSTEPGCWAIIGAGLVAGLLELSHAAAQPLGARALEEGVADTGPLSTGLRLMQRDLRRPTGFDRVFEIDRTTVFGTEQTLIRVDGAVTAIFPRSVYRAAGPGVLSAEIPAGTIFHIGALPAEFGPRPELSRRDTHRGLAAGLTMDLSARHGPAESLSARASPGPESDAVVSAPGSAETAGLDQAAPPTIWTDERFRRLWVAQVLRSVRATPEARSP